MPSFLPYVDFKDHLKFNDWLVAILAIFMCLALICYGQCKRKTNKSPATQNFIDYLLMGRQLTLPLFVATLTATWYGGIFGVTQIAFEQGIYNLFTQGFCWYITYILFALVVVKKIRRYKVATLPELIKQIYGSKSAKLAAVLVFFKTLPIVYAISIGLFIQCLFQLSLFQSTCIGVGFIATFALAGGLRTIVYSDLALFIIMCCGVVSVFVCSIYKFGGLSFLYANLPPSYFQPCGTHTLSTMLAWFFIACSTTFISPAFYQRCLAANSDKVATQGILISTLIWLIFDICTTCGAMYAKAVIPNANSLYAYLIYGIQLLPNGFKGLLIASIAAAITATLDSFLFIASNTLFYDLKAFNFVPSIKLRHCFAIFVTTVTTVVISLCFEGRIEDCWMLMKSYYASCLLLPILFGYLWPVIVNDRVFILNALITIITITYWERVYLNVYPNISSFYIGVLSTCIVYVCNYLTLDTRITTLIERMRRMI